MSRKRHLQEKNLPQPGDRVASIYPVQRRGTVEEIILSDSGFVPLVRVAWDEGGTSNCTPAELAFTEQQP